MLSMSLSHLCQQLVHHLGEAVVITQPHKSYKPAQSNEIDSDLV
jgi:hypothetical protein